MLSDETFRNGEQGALALDVIAVLDIESAILAGSDWGARTADIVAAVWPERCSGLVSVSGYPIVNLEANQQPLPPKAELGWWYDRTAASFDNRDHVDIVIHHYRWRLSLAAGERQYDEPEARLFEGPVITVPTITIGSDFDGAGADGHGYAQRFSGPYSHRVLDGIGHNVPQEAPEAFADAILEVGGAT